MGSSILVSRAPFACLAWCFVEELRCGSPPVRTQLVQQLLTEEVQVIKVLQEQAPITSSVKGPPLKFVEDRRGALHRFHLVRLLGLILGDGGGVEPGLNLEGLHRRRVEGSAFLALFLVAWQWGPLPRWGRQKRLVQLHEPDHRPDRGGDEVREAGLVRVLAGHRVGGQLADVHRGTELEVAGPVRVRAFGTCGPGRRPHCPGHPPSTANACPLSPGWPSWSPCQWAPSSCRTPCTSWRPSSPRAWCSRGRSRMWAPCPGAVLQARAPSQRACRPGVLSRASCSLHLGDVEGLHNALQAPLLELGALKASQEPLDVLGLQSAEPSGRGRIEAREVARHLVIAELVEALRDLEGLGEHAPPRRGGCGSHPPPRTPAP